MTIEQGTHTRPHLPVVTFPGIQLRAISSWGWLPAIYLLNATALLLIAVAYTASRNGSSWAVALFWFSLVLIFAPTGFRVVAPHIARKERMGLVLGLGLSLYLVKVLYTPGAFAFHDEFLHWRTATDIMLTGRLFTPNPILTVSPLYPGLEIVATALANLANLTIFEAGIITLGVVRLMFVLGLYLFYERVGRSEQLGGIAALLYMGNSNFLYFDSQFSYESLSLPLAVVVLYLVAHQQRARGFGFVRLLLLLFPILLAIAVTHHLTAYALAGVLFTWAIVALFFRHTRRRAVTIAIIAALIIFIVAEWTIFTGNAAENYLLPVITGGVLEFLRLLFNVESGRQLFKDAAGLVTPIGERIVGFLSVIAIMAVVPLGLLEIARAHWQYRARAQTLSAWRASVLPIWRRYRHNPLALTFAALVFLHPLMLAFRFTSSGWEIANRSSEFVFWAVAFILAVGILSVQRFHPLLQTRVWTIVFVVWLAIILLGGSISGWPHWARLPGSYLVSADSRSIEAQGIEAARWAGTYLNPEGRIAADRINTLLLATYGHLLPVTHQYDSLYLLPVFFEERIGPNERDLMQRTNLRYLLVDDRMTTALPTVGIYFEAGEPGGNEYVSPPAQRVLSKFDSLAGVNRIFDSGSIKIYDVRGLNATLP